MESQEGGRHGLMRKLMCLGGNYFQMTLVKAAKRLGCHVIDVDYLPGNPAHKYADEYHNISTLDMEAVLKLAKDKKIDGIVSYASDVSAPTAAYVAQEMGLAGNPYGSVRIMARKDLFHPFLREHGLYAPRSAKVQDEDGIRDFLEAAGRPIMLKPPSGSGSKGVSRIDCPGQVSAAFKEARKYAPSGMLAVEEFVQREHYQVAGDAFIVNGKVAFFGIANEHFDGSCSPLVPVGESFPADLDGKRRHKARAEIQKAVDALHLKNGAVNLDFMFTEDGDVFIIELGPRNGGNLITDAILLSSGVDLAEYTVKAALGESLSGLEEKKMGRFIASYIYHSPKDGAYMGLDMDRWLEKKIIRSDIFVGQGSQVRRYLNGGFGIGAALFEFSSKEEMLYTMDHMGEFCRVQVGGSQDVRD